MKKLIIAAVLLSALLVSCGSKETKDPFFEDYYFFPGIDRGAQTIMKLNVTTGSITPLCDDPLCEHDKNCKFTGVNSSSILTETGNKLYFSRRNESDFTREIFSYSPESQSVELVFKTEPSGTVNGEFLGRSNFSIRNGYIWNRCESPDGTKKLERISLKNKKRVELPESAKIPMRGMYEGKFIYPILDDGEYLSRGFALGDLDGNFTKTYATDKYIQVVESEQIENGTIIFDCPYEEDGKYNYERQTLWVCDLKTGEQKLIHDDFGDFHFVRVGNYIYYLNYVDDPVEVGFDRNHNKTKHNMTGGKIMRLDVTTGEETLFMTFDHIFSDTPILKHGKLIFGYQDTDYENYTVRDDGRGKDWYDYEVTRGWVIIDPETKQYLDVVNTADIFK